MKGDGWLDYIASEISSRSNDMDKTFGLRDAAISRAMKNASAAVTEQVKLIVSELQSTRFGQSTVQETRSKNVRIKHTAIDTIGGMTAELAGPLDDDIFVSPKEPADNAMCIRYLTPEKWMWLQHQKTIRFSNPAEFVTDPFDSVFPPIVVKNFLSELSQHSIFDDMSPEWVQSAVFHWLNEEDQRRARYRISCWNLFDEHTSHLMWSQFAGGRFGAAIVCPFGVFRDTLEEALTDGSNSNVEMDGAGFVSYDTKSKVHPPYFKRPEYKDEREIRFVAHALEGDEFELPLYDLIGSMRAIAPPDAPSHHECAVISSWNSLRSKLSD